MKTFLTYLTEQFDNINPNDVLSKLSSLNKQVNDNATSNTTCFGLEDSDGNIIKVYVRSEQAVDFDRALSLALDVDEEQDAKEIAEVLYSLHDKFDITDVQWPTIEEDEEGDETNAGDFEQGGDDFEAPPGDDMNNTLPQSGDVGNEQAVNALDSVLQAMIANAEANRQEALAKAAEARAREAEAAARLADQKLKAEEEVADMESFYDAQNDEKREAKKLAKLAKYRHTIKQREDGTGPFSGPGEALQAQRRDSEERMDMPNGENPMGTSASLGRTQPEDSMDDIQPELQDVGFENEEPEYQQKPKIDTNLRFKDLKAAVKFLHSLRVRRAVHND